jgi:restriction system-associated AAA family ATPase
MKILYLKVIKAPTCAGLLDDFEIRFRDEDTDYYAFEPLCFVGPNGAGKSQLIQILAEALQVICHAASPDEERVESNSSLEFCLEYLIQPASANTPVKIRAIKTHDAKKMSLSLHVDEWVGEKWDEIQLNGERVKMVLPTRIIGYTSGGNETLSLPFLSSRAGYAEDVTTAALRTVNRDVAIPDTRLQLIDYGTNLEVLIANVLLSKPNNRNALLADIRVGDIHSCRCVIQLAHGVANKASKELREITGRKEIQLTPELEIYIEALKNCSTCFNYEEKREIYTFDFLVDSATRKAFSFYWKSVYDLYQALHKISMLNDLAIPRESRNRFKKEAKERRFASRLPEPQDEQKVFRFERVRFKSLTKSAPVDYVSLSDGEHQLGQLLGTLSMQSFPGIVFLLDEPESHFNPQWRAKTITRILELPTDTGSRVKPQAAGASQQECILTTHAPFILSDVPRERVFIFSKVNGKIAVRHPEIETYGAPFDTLLDECFGVAPPISDWSLADINRIRSSSDPEEIEEALGRIGSSAQKAFLFDRLRQLQKSQQ